MALGKRFPFDASVSPASGSCAAIKTSPTIATLLLRGLSTFAVGFVPGYAEIGIWGAVILTVLRLIRGSASAANWVVPCVEVRPHPSPLPASGEREGPLAHQRCATRQAHARVRREGREGEGQRATDLGGLAAQNAVLHLHRLCLYLRDDGAAQLARSAARS